MIPHLHYPATDNAEVGSDLIERRLVALGAVPLALSCDYHMITHRNMYHNTPDG